MLEYRSDNKRGVSDDKPVIKDEWYKYIIENSSEGFFITDLKGNILDVNDAFCCISGYSKQELLSMSILDLDVRYLNGIAPPEELMMALQRTKWTEDPNTPFRRGGYMNVQHRRKDGKTIDLAISMKYVDIMDGVLFHFNRDITEQNRLHLKLIESEEIYHTLINLGGRVGDAVVMIHDTEEIKGIQAFVSDKWGELTGYSRDELLEKSFFDFVKDEYRKEAIERYERESKEENLSEHFGLYIVRRDGMEIPVEITSAYVVYRGKKASVIYICDITERRKIEGNIGEYRGHFEEMLCEHTAELAKTNNVSGQKITSHEQSQQDLAYTKSHFTIGQWQFDHYSQRLFRGNREIRLSNTESTLLSHLFLNKGKVMTFAVLADVLWNDDDDSPGCKEAIRVYIRRLRQKIENDPAHPDIIITKTGIGYYLKDSK